MAEQDLDTVTLSSPGEAASFLAPLKLLVAPLGAETRLASRGCLLHPALPYCCWMWVGVRTGPGGGGGWSKLHQMDWLTDPADIKRDHVTLAGFVWCFQPVAKIPPDCN